MVIQIQTSFTPKKGPGTGPVGSRTLPRGINFFAGIAIVVFSIMAGLSGFVFFYKAHLMNVISGMDVELAKAKKSFEPAFIEEASRLNMRISGAQELLNSHQAISPLFDILEKKTLESMRFQDFNFSAPDGKSATLTMTGQAKSFNSVALQSDVFGTEKAFKDPIFSNFNLNDEGDVIFNFQTSIDPALLRYRETVLGGTGVPPTDTQTSDDERKTFDAGAGSQ